PPDDSCAAHPRDVVDALLHARRRDRAVRRRDDVTEPALHPDAAGAVEVPDVAGAVPAGGARAALLDAPEPVVAVLDVRGADHDLTEHPGLGRQLVADAVWEQGGDPHRHSR